MNSTILKYGFQFLLILFIQVAILNNIELHSVIHPYIYPLFILLLPETTPKWLVLILAFFLGLVMDLFANTPGLHASACVFLAFIRPLVLRKLAPTSRYKFGSTLSIKERGWQWILIYSFVGVFAHHIFYFFVEVFSFEHLLLTLSRIFISTLLTLLLIMIYQSIVIKS